MIWKDVSFLSLDSQFIFHLWASFHAKFGHKDKSFFQVTKCEKIDASPPFLMIKNLMFQFELHPHIGEIRTDILVYEKVGVIKHIKAPARVKVELPDL